MKRYKNISYPCESMQENKKGEYVKHDQAHALLKEAYEDIQFMWYHLETNTLTKKQLEALEKQYKIAIAWLEENE